METNIQRIGRGIAVWWERNWVWCVIGFLLLSLVFVFFAQSIFISIHPGQRGVLWSRFGGGTVLEESYGEGIHVIFPWNFMYIYDVRRQKMAEQNLLLSSDGLSISVSWACRFYPDVTEKKNLPKLHQEFGPDYPEKLVRPEVISAIRRVVGNYTPEEIYSRDEEGLLQEIRATLNQELSNKYVRIDAILLEALRLPAKLEESITDKLTQRQLVLAYQYRLESEEKERRRKIIEAQGIKEFEDISKIDILKWRGIEATVELAKSPNSKIIVIGTDSKGLPIILNTDR